MKGKKGFQPGHKDRYEAGKRPVATTPYCFRAYADQDLKAIPDLANKLRDYLDRLLEENERTE